MIEKMYLCQYNVNYINKLEINPIKPGKSTKRFVEKNGKSQA